MGVTCIWGLRLPNFDRRNESYNITAIPEQVSPLDGGRKQLPRLLNIGPELSHWQEVIFFERGQLLNNKPRKMQQRSGADQRWHCGGVRRT